MPEKHRILVINPGSTSTKIALFEDRNPAQSVTERYGADQLKAFSGIAGQKIFRQKVVDEFVRKNGLRDRGFSAVVGRGGLLKPVSGGTYRVNERMLNDLENAVYGEHASNLGAILAAQTAGQFRCPALIVDPVVVDEMIPTARYSGLPSIQRKSIFHALNQKAVARKTAELLNKPYHACRLIVAHLGGGISVGAHDRGRVIDVNNALDGDGPFTPERAGGLPAGDLIGLCYAGKLDEKTLRNSLVGNGGLKAYLGTHDIELIRSGKVSSGYDAAEVLDAMMYQVAKEIGALAAVLQGQVDAVVLTGGMAYVDELVEKVRSRCAWIAPVKVFPGEMEMEALAMGAYRVLTGEEEALTYK
jgi:butyrate kinase